MRYIEREVSVPVEPFSANIWKTEIVRVLQWRTSTNFAEWEDVPLVTLEKLDAPSHG